MTAAIWAAIGIEALALAWLVWRERRLTRRLDLVVAIFVGSDDPPSASDGQK